MLASFITPSLTKMLYGWSKWGGSYKGIAREILDIWYCQICAEKQSIGMPKYFYSLDKRKREFLAVCSSCWYEIKSIGIDNFEDLLAEIPDFKEGRIKKIKIILSIIENLMN